MRPFLRKAVLMFGVLALFFGPLWIIQGNGLLPDDLVSSDPRLVSRGIILGLAGLLAVFVARKI